MCDELERKREKNREERGKGEEQSELDEGFICRMTCGSGSCHEPLLKVLDGPQSDNILPPLTLVPVRGTNRC